jgi:predicted nucleic acid-binding protein
MPDRPVICNTSPLLYLHQIGHLDLLPALYGTVWTTPGVAQELAAGAEKGYDVPDLAELSWLEIRPLGESRLLPALVDLDRGEAEVIALGLQLPGSLVILDEQLARRIAELFELDVTGTLGLLLRAKQRGHLEHVTPAVEALRSTTMWLSERVIRLVLEKAGELLPGSGPAHPASV